MGSIMSKLYDDMDNEYHSREMSKLSSKRVAFINEAEEINFTEDFEWFWNNREKIIKNRKLIDLIG